MVEDVSVGGEDAVGEPVLAHDLPDVLNRVQLRAFRRQLHQGDIWRHRQVAGDVPAGLVHQQHGMSIARDGGADLGEMQAHRRGVAVGQHEGRAFALGGADGTEQIGRSGALVLRGRRASAAFGPAPGDAVLLTDPRFILEPNLYALAGGGTLRDLSQRGGELFLNEFNASGSWAWWRGRAVSLR